MSNSNIELSKDQKDALKALTDWWSSSNRNQLITLGGFAGCGKTTIISMFRDAIGKHTELAVAFCAYTGKAASVLKSKLLASSPNHELRENDSCGTIHSLIYDPETDNNGEVIGWIKRRNLIGIDLIIIDEASMVSRQMFNDLTSYGIPIVAIGDHGQLPPVDSSGFNLMSDPQLKLETLHRFAENDGLIKVSMLARLEGEIPMGNYSDQAFKVAQNDSLVKKFFKEQCRDFSESIVLCGTNKTRIKMNKKIRTSLGLIGEEPFVNDKVVCLKNNRNAQGCSIYNGMIGEVISKKRLPSCIDVKIAFPGEEWPYKGVIDPATFNNEKPDFTKFVIYKDLSMWRKAKGVGDYFSVNSVVKNLNSKVYLDNFDYGYAITVHKSQGSEWKNVVVLEEQSYYLMKDPDMWRRWLYTAVTRAREKLLVIG